MLRLFVWLLSALMIIQGSDFKALQMRNFARTAAMTGLSVTLACSPVLASPGDTCNAEDVAGGTVSFCRELGLVKDRLRGCSAKENCFSSSAISAGQYSAPWLYNFANDDNNAVEEAKRAFGALKVAATKAGLTILRARDEDFYLLTAQRGSDVKIGKQPAGSSLFYEFLLRPTDGLVLHRGVVDKTVYIFPLQQPVSDFGALNEKLTEIRNSLGWLNYGEN
jgi:hypothetical protein